MYIWVLPLIMFSTFAESLVTVWVERLGSILHFISSLAAAVETALHVGAPSSLSTDTLHFTLINV